MYKIFLSIVAVLVLASSPILIAKPGSCKTTPETSVSQTRLEQLQTKYRHLNSLTFHFQQVTQTNGRLKRGNGEALFYRTATNQALKHAGIMRWDYLSPSPQTILNDGAELSIYTPADNQLIISSAESLDSDITYALFTGNKNLTDSFHIASGDPHFSLSESSPSLQAFLLTPLAPHPQIKRVQIWIDHEQTIKRLLLEDHFSSLTELSFSAIQLDTLPPNDAKQVEKICDLHVPDGTEIIRQ